MSGTLRVLWTLHSPSIPPRPILRCSRCNGARPFESSGKFRLNANGKRLDAWLVYRCAACGDTWNRAIFERRQRGEVEPAMLDALQANDAALAAGIAADRAGLTRWTHHFDGEAGGAATLERSVLAGDPIAVDRLSIGLAAALGEAIRCDRLLALGLGISRARVAALAGDGRVVVAPHGSKPLARPLLRGSEVTVGLGGLGDAATLARRAAGLALADVDQRPAD